MDLVIVTALIHRWAKATEKLEEWTEISSKTVELLKENFLQASAEELQDPELIQSFKTTMGKALVPAHVWLFITGTPKNKGGRGKKNTQDQDNIRDERRRINQKVSRLYAKLQETIESRLPASNGEENIFPEEPEPQSTEGSSSSETPAAVQSSNETAPTQPVREKRSRCTLTDAVARHAQSSKSKPPPPKKVKKDPVVIHRQNGDYINVQDFLDLSDFQDAIQQRARYHAAEIAKLLFMAGVPENHEYRVDKVPTGEGLPLVECLVWQPKIIYGENYKR